jgi:hypothetical protein
MQRFPRTVVLLAACFALPAVAQQEGRPGGARDIDQFIERMMANDANGDGMLSREELPGRFAERLFEAGDANGDGLLSEAELRAAAQELMPRRGPDGQRPGLVRPGQPGEAPARAINPDGRGRPNARPEAPASFHDAMEQSGRSMRMLRRSNFDAQSRPLDLLHIAIIQRGLVTAKLHMGEVTMSEAASERFGDDSAAYQTEFRMTLVQSMMESLALEMAVLKGDADAARESVAELVQLQKEGHDLFQPDEDEAEASEPGRRPAIAPGRPNRPGRPGGDL